MKHQKQARLTSREVDYLQKLYAEMYAGTLEYCDEHLRQLRQRRDAYFQSLKA